MSHDSRHNMRPMLMGSDDRRNGIRNGMVIFAGTENENENAECGMTLQPERNEVEIGEKGEYINKSSYEACTFQKCNDIMHNIPPYPQL